MPIVQDLIIKQKYLLDQLAANNSKIDNLSGSLDTSAKNQQTDIDTLNKELASQVKYVDTLSGSFELRLSKLEATKGQGL